MQDDVEGGIRLSCSAQHHHAYHARRVRRLNFQIFVAKTRFSQPLYNLP
jgi:hypothetical protein